MKTTFSLRELEAAALRVRDALPDLNLARERLSHLCSRDASNLSEEEIIAATIESIAENISDGFVAPFFYWALFGVPGALYYRAVNTLDSMIGYHGEFEQFGKASARLDDVLNWIPARITAGALWLGGKARGFDAGGGFAILRRDGAKTESPNAGRPMAMMSGLLGVELEKPGHYRLGDAKRPLTRARIDEALSVAATAALIVLGVLLLLRRA